MTKFQNALHKLAMILEPSAEIPLKETHEKILAHPLVKSEGLSYPLSTLMEFLSAFQLGMAYAAAKYPGSIPKDIMFYANPMKGDMPMEWLMCRVSADGAVDEIAIAHICIARYCNIIKHGSLARACDHLPKGFRASGRVAAVCHAIEECHHYYWAMVLKKDGVAPSGDRSHPMELAAKEAIRIAITDLCLPIYPL